MTRILGAVLAGGQSRRFGSDKALALYRGKPLIDHALSRLGAVTDTVVICGGVRPGYVAVPDAPASDLGPLGGLCGAIGHARAHGFVAVLTMPCDTPELPIDLLRDLARSAQPAYLIDLPVAGYWPVDLHDALFDQVVGEDRSMRAWVARCGAKAVASPTIANVNRREDLTNLSDNTDH